MKKVIIMILILSVAGIPSVCLGQDTPQLEVSKIIVTPQRPESAKCCFGIQVWVKNNANRASEQFKLWVYVKQLPKPGTNQSEQFITKDHGTGQPIVGMPIAPYQETLVYSRQDWVINEAQGHFVVVEIVGHDTKQQFFESW